MQHLGLQDRGHCRVQKGHTIKRTVRASPNDSFLFPYSIATCGNLFRSLHLNALVTVLWGSSLFKFFFHLFIIRQLTFPQAHMITVFITDITNSMYLISKLIFLLHHMRPRYQNLLNIFLNEFKIFLQSSTV